jgi:hypothetical protein
MRILLALIIGVALVAAADTASAQNTTRPGQGLQPQPFQPPGGLGRMPGSLDYKELVPPLIDALKDTDTEVRQSAAGALAHMGRHAVQPLVDVLKDKDKDAVLRANVAYVLGLMGAAGQEALPALTKLLKDDNRDVRRRAAFAIQSIVKASEAAPFGAPGMGGGLGANSFGGPPGAYVPSRSPGPDPGVVPAHAAEPAEKGHSETPMRTEKKKDTK